MAVLQDHYCPSEIEDMTVLKNLDAVPDGNIFSLCHHKWVWGFVCGGGNTKGSQASRRSIDQGDSLH